MKKTWFVALVLVVTLVACNRRTDETATPPAANTPLVTLAELAADPETFAGQRVQTAGRFAVLPLPPCSALVRLSPATWTLSDSGVVVRVAGLEQIVGPLALDDISMRVEGRWQSWVGFYGCGDGAVESTIWYLQAERILEPNPLSRASLTPPGGIAPVRTPAAAGGQALTQSAQQSPLPSPSATLADAPTMTPSPSATSQPSPLTSPTPAGTDGTAATPTPSPTSLQSPLATGTATPTATATANRSTNPSDTPWPTYTPLSDSSSIPTPTPTSTSNTPQSVSEVGPAEYDTVLNQTLEASQTHRWLMDGVASSEVTISLAAAPGLDLELVLLNPQGEELETADDHAAGGTETISDRALTQTSLYAILVREVNGLAGAYALVITDEYSYPLVFPGNIEIGEELDATLPAMTDHYWHFMADTGDEITIVLTPHSDADLIFTLFPPEGVDYPIDQVDETEDGGIEAADFILSESGFYTILVQEWSGDQAGYRLSLDNN